MSGQDSDRGQEIFHAILYLLYISFNLDLLLHGGGVGGRGTGVSHAKCVYVSPWIPLYWERVMPNLKAALPPIFNGKVTALA